MFERKIMQELIQWKNTTRKKKALVIKGLRQVGKTFTALEFAKQYYSNYIYINFKNNEDVKSIFEGNLVVDRILMDLTAMMPETRLIPYKTLIIFDEIQECSNARASIKPFIEDGRYDVIATGSLLGIRGYNRKIGKGVPTGFEHIIYMKPMDFEEFLWAKGISKDVISYLKDCFENKKMISSAIHNSMMRYFKEYICVGGMPEVVDRFISTNDFNQVYEVQRDIIEEYRDDFGKHLDENEHETVNRILLSRINQVFDSIPSQLAKENKKFQYSKIKHAGRASEYEEAIQWLADAGTISLCYNLSTLELPLEGNKIDNVFKVYMQDSGLFVSMLERGTAWDILNGNLNVYKGAIYENIIADAFSKMGYKLYYYHKDSGLEIDFVMRYKGKVTLIEVKSKTGQTKSTRYILDHQNEYNVEQCIKLGDYNIGLENKIFTVPLYLAFLLENI